jgi:predicted Zn finger-like uncharacterized protein
MRLICPNCDAQYEVPTEVVPTDGRDVQCSNCGQTWYQHHPDHMPPTEDEVEETTVPENEERVEVAEQPQRKEMDPAVADILRQEAEHEADIRENEPTGIESQPDLGLDDAEDESTRRAREARERMARMRGEDPEADVSDAALGSRRDLLPDIEEINSSLRSTSDRQVSTDEAGVAPARKKRGFRRGFLTAALIAIILAALYIFAPAIAKAVPQVDPYLSSYVALVDQGRSWLDGQLDGIAKWLEAKLKERFGIKTHIIGTGAGVHREGKVLNRVIRIIDEGWEYEADPRHAELIIRTFNL